MPEDNWVWSSQGVINMHCPERWGYLLFIKQSKPADAPSFVMPYGEKQRLYLWLVYYKQKAYSEKNKKYASSLAELEITPSVFNIDGKKNTLTMEATSQQFTAIIQSDGSSISINNEGLVQ